MAAADLTAQRLREVFDYNPDTGALIWKVPRHRKIKAGMTAGSIDGGGYVLVRFDGWQCRAHRLAWLLVHGVWPSGEIDHINGVRHDNRLANLRDVPALHNKQNRKNDSSKAASGLPGAYRMGDRWRSQVSVDGKAISLGGFDSAEAANAAFLRAKLQYQDGAL